MADNQTNYTRTTGKNVKIITTGRVYADKNGWMAFIRKPFGETKFSEKFSNRKDAEAWVRKNIR